MGTKKITSLNIFRSILIPRFEAIREKTSRGGSDTEIQIIFE